MIFFLVVDGVWGGVFVSGLVVGGVLVWGVFGFVFCVGGGFGGGWGGFSLRCGFFWGLWAGGGVWCFFFFFFLFLFGRAQGMLVDPTFPFLCAIGDFKAIPTEFFLPKSPSCILAHELDTFLSKINALLYSLQLGRSLFRMFPSSTWPAPPALDFPFFLPAFCAVAADRADTVLKCLAASFYISL